MRTTEIKALLFDFGNALAFLDYDALSDEFRRVLPALDAAALERAEYIGRQALDEYVMRTGMPIDFDQAYELYFLAWMGAAGVPASRLEWCRDRFLALNQAQSLWRVVRPGIIEHLKQFREAGFKLGVVSNANGNIQADAERYGLAEYFDVIIDSHVVGVAKPDPRIFHLALEHIRIPPDQALFAGDLYSIDMVGAKAAGIIGCKLIDVMGQYSWVEHAKIEGIHQLHRP
jgi:putative hydrolase of the HAD superfamily